MTWLLYVLGAYLGACYLWAMYLVVRLYTGKRLRVLLRLQRKPRTRVATKPAASTATSAPTYTTTTAQPASQPQRRKAAA